MVRLRGMPRLGPQGRGMGRPMPRLMRPEPPISLFSMPRGRLVRGRPGPRPGPPRSHLPPPRMAPPRLAIPPPLPPRRLPIPPRPPLPPRELAPHMGRPFPPRRPLPPLPHGPRPGMLLPPIPPRPMPPGPQLRRPIRPGPPFIRGRGAMMRGVKRLGTTTNGRVKKPQKRKEKTEGLYFCESCDRGFKSPELLDSHVAEHQVCGRDGCTFAAHPKVVEKHVKQQHETGLYHRIVFNQNPDDVAKWISDRKNRYPTKQNVERKEAQAAEMVERGERISQQGSQFHNKNTLEGSWKERKKRPNWNTTNSDGNQKHRKPSKPKPRVISDEKWKDPESWRGNLPKFLGTAAFLQSENELKTENKEEKYFSDDEPDFISAPVNQKCCKPPQVSNVLTSLMINYGSDMTDDDNDDEAIAQTTRDTVVNSSHQINSRVQKNQGIPETVETSIQTRDLCIVDKHENEDSDSAPDECSIQREDLTNIPVPKPNEEQSKPQGNKAVESKTPGLHHASRPKHPAVPMKRYQLSLLEKLLQNEIRHERNAILQCVHYVVKKNYFGCGSNN